MYSITISQSHASPGRKGEGYLTYLLRLTINTTPAGILEMGGGGVHLTGDQFVFALARDRPATWHRAERGDLTHLASYESRGVPTDTATSLSRDATHVGGSVVGGMDLSVK